MLLSEENILFVWIFLVAALFAALLLLLNIIFTAIISTLHPYKTEPYECGFTCFDDARLEFSVRYYLIAILFLLFELEFIFILPWALNLTTLSASSFILLEFFMGIVTVGFFYEYRIGALGWLSI